MGTLSREKFTKLLLDSPPVSHQSAAFYGSFRGQVAEAINQAAPNWANSNDEKTLATVYDQVRDYICERGFVRGKQLRPWLIDKDFSNDLDRNEAWLGWEFETGWQSQAARATVNRFVWDNFDGVCFDSEGEGAYTVEITFGPQERSKFLNGTAQAVRFMDFLSENEGLVYNGGADMIGTHINFSHPLLTKANQAAIVAALTRTVGTLPRQVTGHGDCRQKLFGRSQLYGGFFAQDQGGKRWIEGKLFRTVYTRKKFDAYLKTAEALCKSADAIFHAMEDKSELAEAQRLVGAVPYVDNLWEMVTEDAEPLLAWGKKGGGGDVNGGYNKDQHKNTHPQTLEEIKVEADKKRKEEEARLAKEKAERERAEAEARLSASHKALHAAGKRPKGMPESYIFCEHCEVFHNDTDEDDSIWMKEA